MDESKIGKMIERARLAGDQNAVRELSALLVPQKQSIAQERETTGGDVVRGLLGGATLNFGDELRGAASAALSSAADVQPGMSFGDYYDKTRDYERAQSTEFAQASPLQSAGLEFLGGLATGGLGGARAGATTMGRNMLSMSLPKRMAAASGVGAVSGGVAGAGAAPSIGDIPEYAIPGAVVGGVLGPVAEGVTSAGQKAASAIRANLLDPKRRAANALRKTMADAEMTPRMAAVRAEQMGDDAILADTSEAARRQLDTLAQAPGKTRQRAFDVLASRTERQADDIQAALGPAERINKLDELADIRRTQASPQYEQAFEQGVQHTDELERVFKQLEASDPGIWRTAKREGLRALAGEGKDIAPEALGEARPSLRGWQAMKEHLDDLEGAARRAGKNKTANSYGALRRRLLSELDRQNTDYAEARKLWAGTMEFQDAIEDGRKFLRTSSSELAPKLKSMSQSEREAYRVGAVQAVFDRLENMGITHDASKLFRTQGMQRRFKALFGKDKAGYEDFLDRIQSSADKQATYNRVTGGSRTAGALLGDEDSLAPDVARIFADMTRGQSASGALMGAAADAILKGGRKIGDAMTSNRAMRDELGQMLLMSPQQAQMALPGIMRPPPLPQTTGGGLLAPLSLGIPAGLLVAPGQ